MTCDRARDGALLLGQGLFGAPAGQTVRDREARATERKRAPSIVPARDDQSFGVSRNHPMQSASIAPWRM